MLAVPKNPQYNSSILTAVPDSIMTKNFNDYFKRTKMNTEFDMQINWEFDEQYFEDQYYYDVCGMSKKEYEEYEANEQYFEQYFEDWEKDLDDVYLYDHESCEDQYYYDVYGMSKKEYEVNEQYLNDVNRMIEQDEAEQRAIADSLSDDEEDYGGFVKTVRTKNSSRSKEGKKSNEKNKNNIRNNNKRNWEFNDED